MLIPIREPVRLPTKLHPLYGHWSDSRYFLTFPGVNQYVSIPEVTLTGDFEISLEFIPTAADQKPIGANDRIDGRISLRTNPGDGTALSFGIFGATANFEVTTPTGFVELGRLARIVIRRVGSSLTITNDSTKAEFVKNSFPTAAGLVNVIGRHLDEYFDGAIANVRITDNGTPVRFYPLDDNSTTIRDTIGGNDGTYINGAAADWELFTRQADGDWLAENISIISETPVLGDDSVPEFATAAAVVGGRSYRIAATFVSYVGVDFAGWGIGTGVPDGAPFRLQSASAGDFVGGDYTATSSGDVRLFGQNDSLSRFNRVSVNRVIKV